MLRAIPGPVGLLVLMMLNPNSDDPYAVTEQAIVDVIAQMQTQISASTTSAATLALLPIANLKDGELVWITGRRRYFRWDAASTAAALSGEVIVPSPAPTAGRWLTVNWTTSMENALQAAWTVDPVGGSDDAATGPLATYAEMIRRVPVVYIPMTITIASTLPDSDNLVHALQYQWKQSLSATRPTFTVIGTPALSASNNVVTSTDEAGNVAPTLDIGVALTAGTIVQATTGPSTGATAVVVAVIAGTNYRTSPWATAALGRTVPPVAGNAVVQVTYPTVNAIGINVFGHQSVVAHPRLQQLNIKDLWGDMPGVIIDTCTLTTATGQLAPNVGTTYLLRGCAIGNVGFGGSGNNVLIRLCGLIRTTTMQLGTNTRTELSNSVIQGCVLDFGNLTAAGPLGCLINSLGIFGQPAATTAIRCQRQAQLAIAGTLYGPDPGGASVGTDVREGGHISVNAAVTPTMTAATELIFEGAATANAPPPLATGVIPAAAALTTWAQWAAGPFTRNVMSYFTGSTISNHV